MLMPYLRRGSFPDPAEPACDENNLFYVGATRARQQLTLYPNQDFPSPFIAACGLGSTPAAAPQRRG